MRFLGSLLRTANERENGAELVVVPNTVGKILNDMERNYHIEIRRDSTLILVNGVEARALSDLESKVVEGDEVVFVPMLHGG